MMRSTPAQLRSWHPICGSRCWSAALGGGVLMVVVGVLPLGDALSQLAASWNVFLFFLGLGLSVASALVIVGAGSFIRLQAGAKGF